MLKKSADRSSANFAKLEILSSLDKDSIRVLSKGYSIVNNSQYAIIS